MKPEKYLVPFLLATWLAGQAMAGDLRMKVSPQVLKPVNGKLPSSIPLVAYAEPCDENTDLTNDSIAVTGGFLTSTQMGAGKCMVMATITVDSNTPAGDYSIVILNSDKKPVGRASLSVLDVTAEAQVKVDPPDPSAAPAVRVAAPTEPAQKQNDEPPAPHQAQPQDKKEEVKPEVAPKGGGKDPDVPPVAADAAAAGGVCADPGVAPCILQPHELETEVKGLAPNGAKLQIVVNKGTPTPATAGSDGSFNVVFSTPMKGNQLVEVDQISPAGATNPIATATVASQATQLCVLNSAPADCVNQPQEGQSTVTGHVQYTYSEKGEITYPRLNVVVDGSEPVDATVATVKPDTKTKQETTGSTTFTASVSTLNHYNVVKVVKADSQKTLFAGPVSVLPSTTNATSNGSMYTLGMAGIDLASSTTNGPNQQYFAEFNLTAPLPFPKCGGKDVVRHAAMEDRCWGWFNPRIASLPNPTTSQLSSLTDVNGALSGLGQMTLGELTQSLEINGGLEYSIFKPSEGVFYGHNPRATVSLSAILGVGMVTPINSQTHQPEFDLNDASATITADQNYDKQVLGLFSNNKNLQGAYPELYGSLLACQLPPNTTLTPTTVSTCPKHAAFLLPNRSRFYRRYFIGFRVKTYFLDDKSPGEKCNRSTFFENCKATSIFPGTLDVTFGQDETVTQGYLHGLVGTLSADYPFPGFPAVRIFGAAYLRMSDNAKLPALPLAPTSPYVPLNDTSVFIQPIRPADQDYFRIGIGFDIVQAFKSITRSQNNSGTANGSGGGAATPSSGK